MQYRTDPRSGNTLSVLGFGCMRFPSSALGRIDMKAAEALVLDAVEQGVNYFDTAYLYRGNEEAVGAILEEHNLRDRIFLATKLPHANCTAYEDFDRYFDEQKERLRTDRIDYYLIHNIMSCEQWERLVALGIGRWIAEKKSTGEILRIGFSYHGSQGDFGHVLDAYDWDFCQIQYNYVNVNYQAGRAGLKRAAEKGLPVFVMEPLLGGKLTGGLPPQAAAALKRADAQRTAAEWGLRWVWNHPEVTMVLSGMNEASQIAQNVAAAERALPGAMTADELAVVDEVVRIFNDINKVPCTGCNYCMPCPKGLNIPGCFSAYNASYALGWYDGVKQYVLCSGGMGGDTRWASDCIECGACAKHCPQGIAIPEELKRVRKRLQPAIMPPALKVGSRFLR